MQVTIQGTWGIFGVIWVVCNRKVMTRVPDTVHVCGQYYPGYVMLGGI